MQYGKIYLIYNDSMDDMADFKGVIIGDEELAKGIVKSLIQSVSILTTT